MKELAKFAFVVIFAAAGAGPAAAQEQAAPVMPGFQPDPAPIQVAAPVSPVAKAQGAAKSIAGSDWDFLLSASADTDEDVLEMLLEGLEDWVAGNPQEEGAASVQFLKARLRSRLDDHKTALTDLLRLFYEYPGSADEAAAQKLFRETVEKEADKKLKPALLALAVPAAPGNTAARLASMLERASAEAGEFLYAPLLKEYRDFFRRFPDHAGGDVLRMALADLHLKNKEYLAARVAYDRLIAVYPGSAVQPRAKLSLAGVLADNLKEYDRAIAVYLDIVDSYPGISEAWSAYLRLPQLAEKRDKFQLAVETYERIILLYPEKPEAFTSYQAAARVLREDLKKPADAIAALGRLADKYKDARGVDALLLAAEIYRKDLKDPAGEVKTYDRLAAEHPADPQAPRALLTAGEVWEKAKDYDKARVYYETVKEKYPEDMHAKKAQKRLDGLLAR
ncbi:MAG: tetratricopeptide repeat protein [Elusimicrobiales bacterium]|nr:tetratricopeptide repeat protein [Elusimicrobiales bacterium]